MRQKARRWAHWAKIVLLLLFVLYVVWLAWANAEAVQLHIPLVMSRQASLSLLVFLAFGLGVVVGIIGILLTRRRR